METKEPVAIYVVNTNWAYLQISKFVPIKETPSYFMFRKAEARYGLIGEAIFGSPIHLYVQRAHKGSLNWFYTEAEAWAKLVSVVEERIESYRISISNLEGKLVTIRSAMPSQTT